MIPLMISYDIIYIVIISSDSLCTIISLFDWNMFDQKIDMRHTMCVRQRQSQAEVRKD